MQLIEFDHIKGNAQEREEEGRSPSSTIYIYKMFLAKEKALYMTLNQMKLDKNSFIGYFWAASEYEMEIRNSMANWSASTISVVPKNMGIMPPTYNKHTDVAAMFQLIIDTYGVPTYKEANPNPIQIVTFPFMFGMMFGDMGHGSILLIFALILVLFEPCLKNGSMKGILPLRYLFLFMGLSATFCGFCYNEFFSLPLNIFDSCYEIDTNPPHWNSTAGTEGSASAHFFPRKSFDCNYPIGVDPVWGLTTNRLTFVNNIKMKLSVIFGVLHTSMGVIIKGTNDCYFGRWENFIFEVITGLIILEGLFGWMDLLIFAKWFFPYNFAD